MDRANDNISDINGPGLVELYRILFNKEPIVELHNATNDVIVTVRCFAKLKDIGI